MEGGESKKANPKKRVRKHPAGAKEDRPRSVSDDTSEFVEKRGESKRSRVTTECCLEESHKPVQQ